MDQRYNNTTRGGGGGGSGRGAGRGGRGGGDQYQHDRRPYNHGGGRGGGGRGYSGNYSPAPAQQQQQQQQQWVNNRQGGTPRPPAKGVSGNGGGGSGRSWAQVATVNSDRSQRTTPQHLSVGINDPVIPKVQSLKISEQLPPPSPPAQNGEGNLVTMKRPDSGGKNAIRTTNLLVNHFSVTFNPESTIFHYDVDIKPDASSKFRPGKIPKPELRLIRNKLSSDNPTEFPLSWMAYDGVKNIFSQVPLPAQKFKVEVSDGEDTKKVRSYTVTMQLVNELKLQKLQDYLCGNVQSVPRDILQALDVIMKENLSRHNIPIGRIFYRTGWDQSNDLGGGNFASRGFLHSLKPTSQGPALCLDYSVLALRKNIPVLDYLTECIRGFDVSNFGRLRRKVAEVLKGLKVMVTHRVTSQRFVVAGLSDRNIRNLTFPIEDREGKHPPRDVSVIEYFKDTYGKDIELKDIPCLDLGRNNWHNYVPIEYCVVAEGQRYPKEYLNKPAAKSLRAMSLASPKDRKNTINEMVRADDGPCGGDVIRNFGIQVSNDMTRVVGRVIEPPKLKLGASGGSMRNVRVDEDKCQWNLNGKMVVDGKPVERWALINFSLADRSDLLSFIRSFKNRCKTIGIRVAEPLVHRYAQMNAFSDFKTLKQLLEDVVEEAGRYCKDRLQLIVCVMVEKDEGYKYLKWMADTQIGVLTQCCLAEGCLSPCPDKRHDQYLANVALKINAKLGGSNVELIDRLPRFEGEGHVMFIGADVNHPAAGNKTCPSIAAVVATVNWPAANRYAAKICPQEHRKEKILKFGSMCRDLVLAYERHNKVKPDRIVIFRDGVADNQFEMVLFEELHDLKEAISTTNYRPTITLVVAQKRHPTRLFPENPRDGGSTGNIPSGIVVDTTVTGPFGFDFYLCSHYGGLGTSKSTHYNVLLDEHNFTSDELQKLIYHLCFTYARCTKPVSLVPPVYYADLVAYRGRMYQEVVADIQPPASSSSLSSSTKFPDASFDEKFYKMHPALEDSMFFV